MMNVIGFRSPNIRNATINISFFLFFSKIVQKVFNYQKNNDV